MERVLRNEFVDVPNEDISSLRNEEIVFEEGISRIYDSPLQTLNEEESKMRKLQEK